VTQFSEGSRLEFIVVTSRQSHKNESQEIIPLHIHHYPLQTAAVKT